MKIGLILVDYCSMEKTLAMVNRCAEMFLDWPSFSVVIVDNGWSAAGRAGGNGPRRADEGETGPSIPLRGFLPAEPWEGNPVWEGTLSGAEVRYVGSRRNGGYAAGNNLGAGVAKRDFAPDEYLFANNDVDFPEKISLQILAEKRKDQGAAVIGPCLVTPEGARQNPWRFQKPGEALFLFYWSLLLPRRWQNRFGTGLLQDAQSGFCDWVSGSFFLADAGRFWAAGGFDEHTFLYMEEQILSRRLAARGERIYYDAEVRVIHRHGTTVGSTIGVLAGLKADFSSKKYYFRTYGNCGPSLEAAADISFRAFLFFFRFKKRLSGLLKGTGD